MKSEEQRKLMRRCVQAMQESARKMNVYNQCDNKELKYANITANWCKHNTIFKYNTEFLSCHKLNYDIMPWILKASLTSRH